MKKEHKVLKEIENYSFSFLRDTPSIKTTLFGNIDYTYDNNRLVKAGNKDFNYDERGNLTTESVLGITKQYSYSYDNRITKFEDDFKTVNYNYDGLGRRSTRNELVKNEFNRGRLKKHFKDIAKTKDINEDILESILPYDDDDYEISNIYMYEGTSFNIAKEYIGHKYKLGELKGYIKNNTHFNNNYENYDDDNDGDYEYVDVQVLENSYLGRSVLTTKDHRWYNSKELYYLNDSLGSVIGVERYNTVRPIRYNAFGEDINEYDAPGYFGYNGKQFDKITQTYNYGYRDYSPTQARFTTVDPIKDGNNWMVYVNNDPVNYVDAFGLEIVRSLTDDEKEFLNNYLGDTYKDKKINYDKMKFKSRNKEDGARSYPNDTIYMDKLFEDIKSTATFGHEVFHQIEYQVEGKLTAVSLLREQIEKKLGWNNPYNYSAESGNLKKGLGSWKDMERLDDIWTYEGQAAFVEDYIYEVLKLEGTDLNKHMRRQFEEDSNLRRDILNNSGMNVPNRNCKD